MNSGVKIKRNEMKKRSSSQKNGHILTNSGVKQQKGLYCKICEKTVLAHEFWGDNKYFGSLKPRTALQWYQACYFLRAPIFAWGAQAVIWGHGSGIPPVAPGLGETYINSILCYRYVTVCYRFDLVVGFIPDQNLLKIFLNEIAVLMN